MFLWNESINTFAAIWLETLGRACWQGGLALALVWALCRLLPRLSAGARCWLWRLACVKLLVALLWLPTLDLPLLPPVASNALSTLPRESASTPLPASNAPATASLSSGALPAPTASSVAPTVAGWLLLLWAGSVLWQGGQAVRQSLTVRRLRCIGKPLDGGPLDFWNVALSRDLNLPAVSRLLSSTAISTPLLIGMFRPCIVLPESLLETCTAEELRLILAHELAHVRRRDLLWGWLPLLTRLVCGFHPLVRLAERELGMAQEIACDEAALHLTGAASAAYGSLLVRVAARFAPHPSRGFGMIGMTESYHTLKRRLSAMKSFPNAPRHYRVAVRFGLLTLGLAALAPWRVAAQATPPVPPTPVDPAPATAPTPVGPVAVAPQAVALPPASPNAAPASVSVTRAGQSQTITVRRASKRTARTSNRSSVDPANAPIAVTVISPSNQEAYKVSVNASARTAQTVTVRSTSESDEMPPASATVGYPIAAPGMVSSPTAKAGSSTRSIVVSPQTSIIISRTPSTITVTATPNPAAENADAPVAQVAPVTRATSHRRAQVNRRVADAPAAVPALPGVPGVGPSPSLPPTAIPATPATAPKSPRSAPADATPPPAVAPKPPVADPSAPPPAIVPKASGARAEVPVLSRLPHLGRLFRVSRPTAPLQALGGQPMPLIITRRGVPVLGQLPILGRLFRIESPTTLKPAPPLSDM